MNFTRRLEAGLDLYEAGRISFAELDASVQGWINHVRFGDTWGLREHVFAAHPVRHPAPGRARGKAPPDPLAEGGGSE